jgi:small-conductance mechanosensitive channel
MEKFLNILLNIQTAFAQQAVGSASSATSETTNQFQNMATTVFQSIPYWITGAIVIIFSFILSRIVKSVVESRLADAGIEEEHQEIQLVATRASSAVVLLIGITAGLKIAGLDLTSIIAAAAVGIGFAMQSIIMNYISGIIILLQKQFTIGDWVKVNGTEGIIKSIQSRYTIIKKFDGTNVVVPNSDLFNNQVNSLTTNPERRFTLDLNIDLYLDLKEVIDQLYKSIDKCDKILKHPKPSIIVQAPGTFYNSIRIRAWVISKKGILRPTSALVRQIHKDFYRKGWSWPFPTDKIVFDKDNPPDVSARAKDYIEKHKKALKKKPAVIQQQQQVLAQQEQQTQLGAAAIPQAQQIGVGGPQMEAPVWLQQAANQEANQQNQQQAQNQPQQPRYAPQTGNPAEQPTQPQVAQQPGVAAEQQSANQYQQPAVQQNLSAQPATYQYAQQPLVQATPPQQAQSFQPSVAMPIVTATDVQPNQAAASGMAMPLPDVQVPIQNNNG